MNLRHELWYTEGMLFHFLLAFLFVLLSCKQNPCSFDTLKNPEGKIKILATTAMIDDIVGEIGKERIWHTTLIQGEIDPHSYELVKGDDEKFNLADVVFYNGLGLEHGASLRYQLKHHANSIPLGEKIYEKTPDIILMKNGQFDPHIWMDVSIWSKIIDPIVKALSKIDPANASYFEINGEKLKNEMTKIDLEIFTQLSNIPAAKRYLVTSHDAFKYFTRRYLKEPHEENWGDRFRAPEGLAPDGQLSCADIQDIIDHLCHYHIAVVFSESNVSKDSLKKIVSACHEKGLMVRIASKTLYADALGGKNSDAETYLKMIQCNVKVLIDEWK